MRSRRFLSKSQRARRSADSAFRDEYGFTTIGAVLALLIALSLLFSAAQIQRINSVAAQVQDVADAAALAAENEVAEYMTLVRVCDAVVLTMSLTGLTATGLGIAALCTPATAFASKPLIDAGKSILDARDAFSDKASEGLALLQKALPFLSAVNAASVAQANGQEEASYSALTLLCPSTGEEADFESVEGTEEFLSDVDSSADAIQQAGERAEELAEESSKIKEEAFMRDCGAAPGYCMYERASTLAGMQGSDNPAYHSVDAWSFSVALERARNYYSARLAQEHPLNDSVEEEARSVLRKRFYQYAAQELDAGYVHEQDDSFEAYFPDLPRNTDEMRDTSLYTEQAYPVSVEGDKAVMHAWSGCPGMVGQVSYGSIQQMEQEGYPVCPQCEFSAASLGKVAAASSSIENGFEYHYAAVADAAQRYQQAMEEMAPIARQVKDEAGGLLDRCAELVGLSADVRIDAQPPGRFGVVVLAVCLEEMPSSAGFSNAFVSSSGALGARVALSSATLLADEADQQGDVISSILDGLDVPVVSGPLGIVLDCWAGLLKAYASGQSALDEALSHAIDALPFASASGLGTWASSSFGSAVKSVGLEPAKLDALKPILVNSAHVAGKDTSGFGAKLVAVKQEAIAHPSDSTSIFSSLVGAAETGLLTRVEGLADGMELAEIELFEGGPSFIIRIALPASLAQGAQDWVEGAANALRDLHASIVGVRAWE